LESQIIVPKLFAHQLHLSPAGVIVALLVGAVILGFVGAILAIPTAAILQVILHNVMARRQ
jgi:predicted PurR-regulated permease PerM